MDGRQFLSTARFLIDRHDEEPSYRTAISRAYYACFLEMRRAAFVECPPQIRARAGYTRESAIMHQKLAQHLINSTVSGVKKLGRDLGDFRANRMDADYEMSKAIVRQDAKNALEEAEEILKELDSLASSALGDALKEDIERTFSQS